MAGVSDLGPRDQPIAGNCATATAVTSSGPDQSPAFLQFWDKVLIQSLPPSKVTLDIQT